MGVNRMMPHIERRGGLAKWEREGRLAERKDRQDKMKKKPGSVIRPDPSSRQIFIDQWVIKHRRPETECVRNFSTSAERAEWIEERRKLRKLPASYRMAIDLGQLYPILNKIKKQLRRWIKIGTINVEQANEIFEFRRLRALNELVKNRCSHYSSKPLEVAVVFDHHDHRDPAKRKVEEIRLSQEINSDAAGDFIRQDRARHASNLKRSNEKACVRPSKAPIKVKLDALREERRKFEEARKREEEKKDGQGSGENVDEDMEDADGAQKGELEDEPLFPPWKPIDDVYLATCQSHQLKEEALLLQSTVTQVFANTEADYLLPLFLAGQDLANDPRVKLYLPRKPTTPPLPTSSASSPPSQSTNIADSADSDLIPSSLPRLIHFILSVFYSHGQLVYRAIDVAHMWEVMEWKDLWYLAAMAAFAGTDFSGGGILGAGLENMTGKDQKYKDLRKLASQAKLWVEGFQHFDSHPNSPTPFEIGSSKFESLAEMEECFVHYQQPFFLNKPDAPRLPLRSWTDSIWIQAGGGSTGEPISKLKLKEALLVDYAAKMRSRLDETLGSRPPKKSPPETDSAMPPAQPSSPPPISHLAPDSQSPDPPLSSRPKSQNRNHLVSYHLRNPDSPRELPFDARPPLPKTANKENTYSFKVTGNVNCPALLQGLKREKGRIDLHIGTNLSTDNAMDVGEDGEAGDDGEDGEDGDGGDERENEEGSAAEDGSVGDDPSDHSDETGSTSPLSHKARRKAKRAKPNEGTDKGMGKGKGKGQRKGKEKATVDENDPVGEVKGDLLQGKGKANDEAEEKDSKSSSRRFPNDLDDKEITSKHPAGAGLMRQLQIYGFDTHAIANLFAWIRQVGAIEMPAKVELILSWLAMITRVWPERLVQLVGGGRVFTDIAASLIGHRQSYAEQRRQSSATSPLPLATTVEKAFIFNKIQEDAQLEGAAAHRLQEFVETFVTAHRVDQLDMKWIRAQWTKTRTSKEMEMLFCLAVIQHHKLGHASPRLVNREFDKRNLISFATSIKNSTSSAALSVDFIITKEMCSDPFKFVTHDDNTSTFCEPKDGIRRTHALLNANSTYVLSLLPLSSSVQNCLRERLSTARIGNLNPTTTSLASPLATLKTKLTPLISSLAVNAMRANNPTPLTTSSTAPAVTTVVNFLAEIWKWVVLDLRHWVDLFKLKLDTLEDWVVEAGGTRRTIFEEGRTKKGVKKEGKKGSKKKKWSNNDDPDAPSNKALSRLQAYVVGVNHIRGRSFRYSPQTIFVNMIILYWLSRPNFGLEFQIEETLEGLNVAAIEQNARLEFHNIPPFELPSPQAHSPPRPVFNAERIAQQAFKRHRKEDPCLRRQLDMPNKVLFRNLDSWQGLDFKKDESKGAFVERDVTEPISKKIKYAVDSLRAFFKFFNVTNEATARHGSCFLMDLLFKPLFGQRVLNGDLGISAFDYHFGVVDPRYPSRKKMKKMSPQDRSKTSREIMVEEMSVDKDLKKAYKKLEPALNTVEQVRVEVVKLTDAERTRHRLEREAALEKHNREMLEYQVKLDTFNANSDRLNLEKPKAPKRVRYRKEEDQDPRFKQVAHPPEPVRTQFVLIGQRFSFTSPPNSARLPPPSQPQPQPYERKPPHLFMAGVPEDADEFDRPARAHQIAKAIFDEGEDPDAKTRPIVVVVDEGQHVALAKGNFKLTEEGSTRHYQLQRPYAVRESENRKVARVYEAMEPQSRLFEAQKSYSAANPLPAIPLPAANHLPPLPAAAPTVRPNSSNFILQQQVPAPPTLPTPRPAQLPPTVPQVLPSQLSRLSPMILAGIDVKRSQYGQVRAREVEKENTRRYQKEASREVKLLVADHKEPISPSSASSSSEVQSSSSNSSQPRSPQLATDSSAPPLRSILYLPGTNTTPQAGGKGQNVNRRLQDAYWTALCSNPGVNAKRVTVGEGFSSSVCPDPDCRGSLFSACRHASPNFDPMNRVKYCPWQGRPDHRDGLAPVNIFGILYHLVYGIKQNPLSLDLAQEMENPRRLTPHQVRRTQKAVAVVAADKSNVDERRIFFKKLTGSQDLSGMRDVIQDCDRFIELDSDDEEGEAVHVEGKKKRRRGKRGMGGARRKTKNHDFADPINDN
ncbi:hypothetical protein JCM5353_001645 [Sporobolomyces roseus]